jgi:polyribonucleotide nucleotidyltransferase
VPRDQSRVAAQMGYRERLYAVGKIPSTYNKQEGGPKEREVETMVAMERALRPLFAPGFLFETQVWGLGYRVLV